MEPVRPSAGHENSQYVEFAKHQPEYRPLPAFVDRFGLVQTEWELTDEERATLVAGGRIRLWVHTHGNLLQPVQMEVVVLPEVGPA